jgi:signal transduction histidine kinase
MINRIVLKQLWKPFYSTLDAVSNFKVVKDQALNFTATSTDEFSFMNNILNETTLQAQKDYRILKEFTENAAHEMQTPLAVIRSKLDLLIQDEDLKESQSRTVQTSYKAIEKLSKLNQSLLLLAKIENRQFEETETIDLKKKLEEKIEEFNELWESQELSVVVQLKPVHQSMNAELAEILLNNLLSNAIRHNIEGGCIRIELTTEGLIVENTSHHSELDHNRLFNRFYKPAANNEFNGLGLSIIKQICNVSGFNIAYSYKKNMHRFMILWQ